MKQGRRRTLSVCLTDIKEKALDKITRHANGKAYVRLDIYDTDEPDQFNNDFSVSVSLSKAEIERSKGGEKIKRVFVGNGRIWEDTAKPLTPKEADDLPF